MQAALNTFYATPGQQVMKTIPIAVVTSSGQQPSPYDDILYGGTSHPNKRVGISNTSAILSDREEHDPAADDNLDGIEEIA